MRIFEITQNNQTLIELRGIRLTLTKEYNELVDKLGPPLPSILKYRNFGPQQVTEIINKAINLLNKFEEDAEYFINADWDDPADIDIINAVTIVNQQLTHIKQLRQQLGI